MACWRPSSGCGAEPDPQPGVAPSRGSPGDSDTGLFVFLAPPPLGLRKVMVRAHRQAWCWQDEWYGLNMDNIRELEKEAQLMLSRKMAQFNEEDKGAAELAKNEAAQDQASGEPSQPSSSGGEPLAGRGLKKQWSTSSKSSRSSKRGGEHPATTLWGPPPYSSTPVTTPQGSSHPRAAVGCSNTEGGLLLSDPRPHL